jgi:hypothetical protein
MKPTAHTRQVHGISRDTTLPQMLHALPINSTRRERYSPPVILATYAVAGFIGFAVVAAVVNLILPID